MYPIALNLEKMSIAVIGGGEACWRRVQALLERGSTEIHVYATHWVEAFQACKDVRIKPFNYLPDQAALEAYQVVMVADLETAVAAEIARNVRALGRLVNVEDEKEYCDFYFSSMVTRGDLIIGINTSGKSPALSMRLRKYFDALLSQDWSRRLNALAQKRLEWKKDGASFGEVLKRSNRYIDEQQWLEQL